MLAPKTLLQNRYEIVRQIGQGGMGSVYEAMDKRLHARVALKETLFTDSSMQKAFEREAKLLARLRHPVLPKVFDYFFEGNGQFLVMEYIPGDDLSTLMERRGGKFPPAEVYPWVQRWADQLLGALEYLHSQSPPVIHRDIKPQNLKLIGRADIVLLDFGLSRGGLADMSTVTARGNIEGYTPNYAPLEQIRGSKPDIRSDLYSLSATLYHFLTGVKPADALTRAANLLNNQNDPLRPIKELNPYVPASIAAVLEGTLSLNPDNRPDSATVMRKVLQRVSTGTRPLGDDTQTSGGKGTQPLGSEESPIVAQHLHVTAQTLQVSGPAAQGGASGNQGETAGDSAGAPTEKLEANEPPGALIRTLPTGSSILTVAFSSDGVTVAAAGEDHTIGLWNLNDGRLLSTLEGHTAAVRSIRFSPDGQKLVSGSEDGTVRLWWVKDGVETHQTEVEAVESVAFSPDGCMLAVGGWMDDVYLFEIADKDLVEKQTLSATIVHSVAFSPDGQMVAAGCYDTTVRLWQVSDGELVRKLEGHTNYVLGVVFSPDGQMLVSGGGGAGIRIWRVNDGRQLDILRGHSNLVHGLSLSTDGKLLASGSGDGTVRVWRIQGGTNLLTLEDHGDGVTSVAFSPDGRTLVSGCRDTKIRLWQVQE
jgi:serine/threonine protein kinase